MRRFAGNRFLCANEFIWNHLPSSLKQTRLVRAYGSLFHALVRRSSDRQQYHGTFFFRNRPELDLMRSLVDQRAKGAKLNLAVLACSNGAEIYSILWTLRMARPDLTITVQALDISSEILSIAREGTYSITANKLVDSEIFERITDNEMQEMFMAEDGHATIKAWLKDSITFQVADAGDPALHQNMEPQHIVVANKFLCHMAPHDAERCLRNLAKIVEPGGYLFVSGVDIDVRTKVALDLGWTPVLDLIEEIHNGDYSIINDWPCKWWGLEPFTRRKCDWMTRYAAVFHIN
jgi:chemotaxis methyl-accepting protein methylase